MNVNRLKIIMYILKMQIFLSKISNRSVNIQNNNLKISNYCFIFNLIMFLN